MRCIHSHRNCFSNLPSPTKACQQRYGDVSKVFWKFTTPYRGMPGGISISTEIVSEIYPDLLTHVGKAMGMHLQCFGHLSFPTEACQEVYPYPPKLFWQFTLTYHGMSAKVCACCGCHKTHNKLFTLQLKGPFKEPFPLVNRQHWLHLPNLGISLFWATWFQPASHICHTQLFFYKKPCWREFS